MKVVTLKFIIFSILSCSCLCDVDDGLFTIVGSKLLRKQSKYHVVATPYNLKNPIELEIKIRNSKPDEAESVYEISKNVTLGNDGETQNIEFDLKDQPVGDYSIEVSSEKFNKEVKLNMNTKQGSVFVQTDKAIYKPADKVNFRVAVLDEEMRPRQNVKVDLFIMDGADNRIKMLENVKLHKGVYQDELQLSDLPVLGTWNINVQCNGKTEFTKSFSVEEYTLPKFELKIDANPDANFKDGKIFATVSAKYTFGKIAKGTATVTAELVNNRWYWRHQGNSEGTKVVKTIEVNGKNPIEFDIESELKITDKSYSRNVNLMATFKEELTGREMNATTTVTIEKTPYKIELTKSAERFKPGLPFRVSCFVSKNHKSTPVTDEQNPLEITIVYSYDILKNCTHNHYYHSHSSDPSETEGKQRICREEKSYEEKRNVTIKNGVHDTEIDLPSNITRIDIKAKYLDTENSIYYITKAETESNQYLQIEKQHGKWRLNKKVRLNILSTEPMKQLTYHVIAKGDIVDSNTRIVENSKSYQLEISPKSSMIPKAKIVVYYVTSDGEIISDSTEIEFENELNNFVKIELSKDEVGPSDDISISISSNPNSFVALLGVDQSVLLLKSGNDIEESAVLNEVGRYNDVDHYNYIYTENYDWRTRLDFENSNAFIITNAKKEFEKEYIPYDHGVVYSLAAVSDSDSVDMVQESVQFNSPVADSVARPEAQAGLSGPAMRKGESPQKPITIRKEFPETWLFESLDFDNETSQMNLTKKVPDTITSWVVTAFSVDPVSGIGVVKNPSKFKVFQPFFVTTNLPYSIKRGEVVSIPIIVFNYLDSDQEVEVTLSNAEGEFEFAEVNEEENKVGKKSKRATDEKRTKSILVKSQEGVTLPFMIRPLKVGHITIKAIAKSDMAGDGVERLLIVQPEGVTHFKNKALFIDLRNATEFDTKVDIEIPSNAVPDSTRIEASAIGDLMGVSIENLDKLIKLPYGCGEQNMLNFVPNIVVLDYLTSMGKLTPEIETKTKKFLVSGYQRELSYKHDDGSYSAFGKSDKSGSTWLTAFVAKSYQTASKYIAIDEKNINESLNFLANVQAADGSFPEHGQVFHTDMQGGSSKGIALTAYTLLTFLESESHKENYKSNIENALKFIKSNLDDAKDNYTLAILAYVLHKANDDLAPVFLNKLDIRAVRSSGLAHWEKTSSQNESERNSWNSDPKSLNIEMTAYALLSFIESGNDTEAIPIMRWMVGQRNENGGFQSTQDTVVGLESLARIAAKIFSDKNEMKIDIKVDGKTSSLDLNEANALILQKIELSPLARTFEVSANGNGVGIVQFAYRYNMDVNALGPQFIIETSLHENSNKNFIHLIACTRFIPDDETSQESNMAVMEIELPSGFTFDSDTTDELMSTMNVKKIEVKDSDTKVIIYFDSLISKENICPEIKAYRVHSVAKQRPSSIKVYDYYDTARKASSFYNPPEISLCDICNGADECKKDCEEPEINVVS